MTDEISELGQAALDCLDRGWSVIPLKTKGKRPNTVNGLHDWTDDPNSVRAIWSKYPDKNIGVVCGEPSNGLIVIDFDVDDDEGYNSVFDFLIPWEQEHGELPETVTEITGRGGLHYFYRTDRKIQKCENTDLHVDIRAEGSYVMVSPSIHPNGNTVEWENHPDDYEVAWANETVYELIERIHPAESTDFHESFKLPEGDLEQGSRDSTLYKWACSMWAKNTPIDVLTKAIYEYNENHCKPPLPKRIVDAKIRSATKHKPGMSEEVKQSSEQKSSGGGNSKSSHLKIAKILLEENHACFIDGVPAVFLEGRYETGWDAVDKATISHDEGANTTKRKEVREYIKLKAPHVNASPPNLIGFQNGVLDITTMKMRNYSKDDIIQNIIPHEWNQFAEFPLVDVTLRKLAANDPTIELNLTEFMGLCLYRSNELAFFPMLLGKKGKNASNGKSTYINMVRSMLGKGNSSSLSFNDLGKNFAKCRIAGMLANLGDDISSKKIDANSLETVKKAATGDRIFCDVKNSSGFEFDSYCTFIFSSNKMPNFESEDEGLNRRMFPIRFNGHFSRDDPDFDPRISKKLSSEAACQRMLVRAVEGLRRCIENNGPTPNAESVQMLEDIKVFNNNILQWMKEEDKSQDDFIGCVPSAIYSEYHDWCVNAGIRNSFGLPGFGRMLTELFGIESHIVSENGEKKRRYRYIDDL